MVKLRTFTFSNKINIIKENMMSLRVIAELLDSRRGTQRADD